MASPMASIYIRTNEHPKNKVYFHSTHTHSPRLCTKSVRVSCKWQPPSFSTEARSIIIFFSVNISVSGYESHTRKLTHINYKQILTIFIIHDSNFKILFNVEYMKCFSHLCSITLRLNEKKDIKNNLGNKINYLIVIIQL